MGFFDWLRSKTKPRSAADEAEALTDVEDLLRMRLMPGFSPIAEVREWIPDLADDYGLSLQQVEQVFDDVVASLLAEQAAWPEGDEVALEASFEELNRSGIVARMDFTCCQTCGHDEISDEDGADEAEGYVFFHQQDSERLEPGGSELMLAFGSLRACSDLDSDLLARAKSGKKDAQREVIEASELRVAQRAVEVLRGHGLQVDWDGTIEQRIEITDVDWRKRVHTG